MLQISPGIMEFISPNYHLIRTMTLFLFICKKLEKCVLSCIQEELKERSSWAPGFVNRETAMLSTNGHLWQVEYDGVGDDWNNEGAGRELLPKGGNFILFCSVFGLIVLHSVCCWFLFFLQHFRSRSRLIDLEISLSKRSTLWSRKRSTTWHWGKNISLVQNV